MEAFRADGHLTEEALRMLAQNQEGFDDLERLEMAEHLAFCDYCLQRYTEILETAPLLVPRNSCQRSLWVRTRTRTLRLVTSRYATAAAAVALALTVLWGGERVEFVHPVFPEGRPSISRQLSSWTGEISESLNQTMAGLSEFFDNFGRNHTARGGIDP